MPNITLLTSPLPEETFLAPSLEIPSTKSGDGRQILGKCSSGEPSTIFIAGTSESSKEMSVSETPIERMSVHQSLPTPKPNERVTSETPAEPSSETPIPPKQIDLLMYITKAVFELQMPMKRSKN